jgi:hypothetical protein
MMQIDDLLLHASLVWPRVDPHILLTSSPAQPMQPQEIAVGRLHDMLFGVVSV